MVQIDYNFAGTQRELNRTILTACDVMSGLVMCIVVPSKEVSHYHIVAVKNFLLEAGRTGAILQGDNEQAIRSLITKVCTDMPGLTKRFSPLYSSQSLGSVGQAQRQLYAQIRALRLQMEDDYQTAITSDHLIVPWLVLHAAWLLNRYVVHDDGKTSYERRWNTRYNCGLCKFGECVHYKLQVAARQGPRKLDAQWGQGLWLGKDSFSNEALVSTEYGRVTKSRSIRRLPPSEHYQLALLTSIRVAPWELDHYLVVRQTDVERHELGTQFMDVEPGLPQYPDQPRANEEQALQGREQAPR